MDSLNITATSNGLNYLPEYVAGRAGIFTAHDLEVFSVARDPWTVVLDDLKSGAADLALGGLWVPAMYAGTPRKLTVVGQLNNKFPMAIVARNETGPVSLDWLARRVVLAPGAGGSAPYEFTAGLIREAGLNPAATRWVRDLPVAMLLELYSAGLGDAIVLDRVSAKEAEHTGLGHVVFSHLAAGGVMPNSVYYCRTDQVAELADRTSRFMTSIAKGMDVIRAGSAQDVIAEVLAERWPGKDQALLRHATAEMADGGVWDSASIDEAASDRWMRILVEAGLVSRAPSLRELTGPRPAGVVS